MNVVSILHTERVDLGPEFDSGASIMACARAAEAAGFSAVAVTDHPMPDDEWMRAGGHHALDPFVALSFAAAATTRLKLLTYVYVLPYRNPFLSAKAAASLDVASGGRLIFGVAAGYLEPEFGALGVPFGERVTRCDDAIRLMKRAWSEDGVVAETTYLRAQGHTQRPRPLQQPHPPIWVGGNSKQAIRRAVTLGDGWMPMFTPAKFAGRRRTAAIETVEQLADRIRLARDEAALIGRTGPFEVAFTPLHLRHFGEPGFEPQQFLDHVGALREAGVTTLCARLPASTCAQHVERLAAFGAELMPTITG
jgi:probable F420-dependent oxidoreductase